MGLIRSKEDYKKRAKQYEKGYELADTTIVTAMFITTREAIQRVLPHPQEPEQEYMEKEDFGNELIDNEYEDLET